ncbi:MAG: hypothetical protein M1820_002766 [Bogoriella megaspora]|nr:MAG: hypothetical protein M1820_002766 [Bogoriella megaspora]
MSTVGPELPPHLLAKRKRKLPESEDAEQITTSNSESRSASPGSVEKRRRVAGPALPPASLDEKPVESPEPSEKVEQSDSDSDDDYGPTLPTAANQDSSTTYNNPPDPQEIESSGRTKSLQRDEWMMMPPKADGLAARMDPTKARPRKFNTGKGARAPNHGDGVDASWTETPEEKRKRLQDKVMGVTQPTTASATEAKRSKENEDTARRIRDHDEKVRGKSLYEQHSKTVEKDADDDPSKRAFDREKDIGGGMKIGRTQRKEMLNRAAGFSSRFSSGSYL